MPRSIAGGLTTREEVEARVAGMRQANDDESILMILPQFWRVSREKCDATQSGCVVSQRLLMGSPTFSSNHLIQVST